MAVQISDIARAAGVSIATVSRVLNGDSSLRIQPETRERVLDAAQALGYESNLFAAALRTRRTGILGALTPNLAGTFLPLLTMALEREARARGFELLVGTPQLDGAAMAAQLNKFQRLLFDGLLLLGDVLDYQATIRKLDLLKKPYVSVCASDDVAPPLVKVDERQSMSLAITYLRELGHTRIGYLGSVHWQQERFRLTYFKDELARQGLPFNPAYTAVMEHVVYQPTAPDFQSMWTRAPMLAAQALLQGADPPTAIVCANDGFALAAIKGAQISGLRVPEDVSIIGHNDEIPAALFYPELTTIRQPVEAIAAAALDRVIARIETGADADDQPCLLPPALVVRGTCAPPPAARQAT